MRSGSRSRSLALPSAAMLLLLLAALAEAGEEMEEMEEAPPVGQSRPYAVLKTQNLVLMGSVFSILLTAMILMAVCVYKPIRRR